MNKLGSILSPMNLNLFITLLFWSFSVTAQLCEMFLSPLSRFYCETLTSCLIFPSWRLFRTSPCAVIRAPCCSVDTPTRGARWNHTVKHPSEHLWTKSKYVLYFTSRSQTAERPVVAFLALVAVKRPLAARRRGTWWVQLVPPVSAPAPSLQHLPLSPTRSSPHLCSFCFSLSQLLFLMCCSARRRSRMIMLGKTCLPKAWGAQRGEVSPTPIQDKKVKILETRPLHQKSQRF